MFVFISQYKHRFAESCNTLFTQHAPTNMNLVVITRTAMLYNDRKFTMCCVDRNILKQCCLNQCTELLWQLLT